MKTETPENLSPQCLNGIYSASKRISHGTIRKHVKNRKHCLMEFSFPRPVIHRRHWTKRRCTKHLQNTPEVWSNSAEVFQVRKLNKVRVDSLQRHEPAQSQTSTYHTDPDPQERNWNPHEFCTQAPLHTMILQLWSKCTPERPQQQQQGFVTFLQQCRAEGEVQSDGTSASIHRETRKKVPKRTGASSTCTDNDLCVSKPANQIEALFIYFLYY